MLQQTFLDEMFKGVTIYEEVYKSVAIHVQDRDISKDGIIHKKVLAVVKKLYSKQPDILPTLGQIQQMVFSSGNKSMSLDKIVNVTNINQDAILEQLGEYIISVRSEQAIHDFVSDFNKNTEHRKPVNDLKLSLSEILDLNIGKDNYESTNPFDNYHSLVNDSMNGTFDDTRVPFSIPEIDELTHGGMISGDIALFIMRSGVGKSTILKYISYQASRLGYSVLHFQLEGNEKEAQMKYNQLWTGLGYRNIMRNSLPPLNRSRSVWSAEKGRYKIDDRGELIELTSKQMMYAKERFNKYNLEIISFEEFGTPNMKIVEEKIIDYIERNGKAPDLISVDSLDLMYPGDGQRYGVDTQGIKMRIQNSAKLMKNFATRYGTRFLTVTQTGNVRFEDWNNEDFVLDRSYSLGDKNIANPFSFVFTGNRTISEKQNNLIRIFVDKLRDYDGEGNIYELLTDYDHGKAININEEKNKKLVELNKLRKDEGSTETDNA